MFRWIRQLSISLLICLGYALAICLVTSGIGVISHLLIGGWVFEEPNYARLAKIGFHNGVRYGGLWAGGTSIVLCVMRARKQYLKRNSQMERTTG